MCYVGGWIHGVSGTCMAVSYACGVWWSYVDVETMYSGCGWYWACSYSDIGSVNVHSSVVSVCCMVVQSVCTTVKYVGQCGCHRQMLCECHM